jgi:tetrahydromethanopterin S-methyltransferase subunit E
VVVMLFSERNYEHAIYKKIVSNIMNCAVIAWILLFILNSMFDWTFLDYINTFVKIIFIIGLIIGSIPDFLEKDGKGIFWDIVIILILIFILFIL